MSKPQDRTLAKRIQRIKNRIRRTEQRLDGCAAIRFDSHRQSEVMRIVQMCDGSGRDFEDVVDRVADRLDDLIEPRNPAWEWLSDLAIDIVAHAAVAIWRDTEERLHRRLRRDRATLERLEQRAGLR